MSGLPAFVLFDVGRLTLCGAWLGRLSTAISLLVLHASYCMLHRIPSELALP